MELVGPVIAVDLEELRNIRFKYLVHIHIHSLKRSSPEWDSNRAGGRENRPLLQETHLRLPGPKVLLHGETARHLAPRGAAHRTVDIERIGPLQVLGRVDVEHIAINPHAEIHRL